MQEIIIVGASGHAKVAYDIATLLGCRVLAFVESQTSKTTFAGRPVFSEEFALQKRPTDKVFVAVGNPRHRKEITERWRAAGYEIVSLVHPSAIVAQDVIIGEGTVVMASAVINGGSRLGKGVIVNTGATVDHDCTLGDYVHVCPGVSLGGDVIVGTGTWVGIGATVIQGITLGDWNMIGAGSVVVRDTPNDIVAFGNPAIVKRRGRYFDEPPAAVPAVAVDLEVPGHMPGPSAPRATKIGILFTGSGRRVSLLQFFRSAGRELGISVEIHAADVDPTAPTWEIADFTHRSPSADHPDFIPMVLDLCRRHHIDLVIPLIDPELPVLAAAREQINAAGAELILSDLQTVRIAEDKLETYKHFLAKEIPTPKTWDLSNGKLPDDAKFPLVLKPRFGSGSVDVVVVHDHEEFDFYIRRIHLPCAQVLLTGNEYTFDVFIPKDGSVCIVPRLRIQTRAGETSKGRTLLDPELIAAARQVLDSLPGPRGPLNIQAFRDGDGTVKFTEINPRFGGGYVLTHRAGGDFAKALIWERSGCPGFAPPLTPRSDVVVLRYDHELITDLSTLKSRGYHENSEGR